MVVAKSGKRGIFFWRATLPPVSKLIGGKKMSKKLLIALLVALMCTTVFTGCGVGNSDETAAQTQTQTTVYVDNRSEAEKFYDEALQSFQNAYPYVSIVAFDEKTRKELDAIPEKLKIYQETFDVELEDTEKNSMLIEAALSNDHSERLAVAQRSDCPDELIVKIAKQDPDMVIRFDALGNIISRDEFPAELLGELAKSEYPNSRLIAIMHPNCDYAVVESLVNDPDEMVSRQVAIEIGQIDK